MNTDQMSLTTFLNLYASGFLKLEKRMVSNLLEHMLERFMDVFLLIYHGIQVVWKAILILYWRQSVFLN